MEGPALWQVLDTYRTAIRWLFFLQLVQGVALVLLFLAVFVS